MGSKTENAAAFARGAVRTKRLAADKNFMAVTVVVQSGKWAQKVDFSSTSREKSRKEEL